ARECLTARPCATAAPDGFRSDIACPRTGRDRTGPSAACADTHSLAVSRAALYNKRNNTNGPVSDRRRNQSDFLELGRDNILVEGLHDVFVGAGMQRSRDMVDAVLRGAEHDLRHV